MIMSPLIAFLIVFVLLLIALIKLKVTPSVGLFAAAIIFGLMVGMPAADILSKLPAGFILSIPIYFGCAYIMTAPLVTS